MSAEATIAQAKAQLSQAQTNLERTRILSPADGYVTNLLATLVSPAELEVRAFTIAFMPTELGADKPLSLQFTQVFPCQSKTGERR